MPKLQIEDTLDAILQPAEQAAVPPDDVAYVPDKPIGFGTASPASGGTTVVVTSGVFKWTVSGVAESGTFVNGDPWVVPADTTVSVLSITPGPSTQGTGPDARDMSGSMINPNVYQNGANRSFLGSPQGYDKFMYGPYAASGDYNPALNVAKSFPIQLVANDSLVSTQSEPVAGARPQLKRAAVLTVLGSAPAAGSFRPPYVKTYDGVKTLYSSTGIDYNALAILSSVGAQPTWEEAEEWVSSVHLNHTPGWIQRFQHPTQNMPDYGQDVCCQRGTAILMCLLNVAQSVKERTLLGVLQIGIDMYGQAKASEAGLLEGNTAAAARANFNLQLWPSAGGHGNGNKWIILFTGMVLGIQDMIDITADDSAVAFSEDDSTTYLTVNAVPNTPEFCDRFASEGTTRWDERWVALTSAEVAAASPPLTPTELQANQSNKYRRCCTTNAWWGMVLGAAALPNGRTNWGHEALFDYQVRYLAVEPVQGGTGPELKWPYYGGLWCFAMFEAHKGTYGLT